MTSTLCSNLNGVDARIAVVEGLEVAVFEDPEGGPSVAESAEGWFHVDTNGCALYTERFFHACWFREGLAVVEVYPNSDGACYIKPDGNVLFPSTPYLSAESFEGGLAMVCEGPRKTPYHINTEGEPVEKR